jgi:Phage integrase, N-terminal SAM-like domain
MRRPCSASYGLRRCSAARCGSGARTPGSCASTGAWTLPRDISGGRHERCTSAARNAARELTTFVTEVCYARIRAGMVAELLERWFVAASPQWAAPTVRQTRSVIDRHLISHLGHLQVPKLTTADIDDVYGHLLRGGGRHGRPLATGTVGYMSCCTGPWRRRCAGSGFG